MRVLLRGVVLLALAGCGAPEIESDLDTDTIPVPPRVPDSSSSSGGTSGTSGTSGSVAPPPAPPDQKLTVTLSAAAGTVSSSPAGLTCTGTTCTGTFARGTSVTVSASPAAGAIFSGWSGAAACPGTAACVVKMDADVALGADLVALDGSWKGTYTNTRVAGGCTFNNAGNVAITSTFGGGALEHAGTIDGLELRQSAGCALVGKANGTAPKSTITIAGDTLTGTWTFAIAGVGSLAFPFTAKVQGGTIKGSWTCATCTGSFTLTKP